MNRFLREPLVHFLLLGAALFLAWHFLKPASDEGPASRQLLLSLDEITQQAMLFQARWNRAPTQQELEQLMEARIQEEILYREALALGLDKDDTIVKRRMAQKMQFLAEDVATARVPDTAELEAWFAENARQFAQPSRFSFRHLYFSPDLRGANAHDDAVRALSRLDGQPEDAAIAGQLADPFMFQDYYRDRAVEFLGKEFGPQFAMALERLPPGSWQGPIESGFGWHLVYVDTVIPGRLPDFEEVMPDVKTAWLAEQKATAWARAYEEMRRKYTVLLPQPPDPGRYPSQPAQPAGAGTAAPAPVPPT